MKEKTFSLTRASRVWLVFRQRLLSILEKTRLASKLSTLDLAILGILVTAAVIRIWGLNAVGYNSDEEVYAGQGAAIARDPVYSPLFPVFRAQPLLFQFLLSLLFRWGVIDWLGRLLTVGFGLATVFLTYRVGETLYGRRAGLYAALFLSLIPYHVVGSRQVLLDAPMTFFALLTVYFTARYAMAIRPAWLYAASAALGLTVLAKETGVLFLGSLYVFFALSPEVRARVRDLVISLIVWGLVILPYPLSVLLAQGGGSQNTPQYLIWQFFRQPNHSASFYFEIVPPAVGWILLLCAGLGLLLLFRQRSWRETLLLSWILVPVVFFQLWPTKGYLYLLPIAPPLALLGARFIAVWFPDKPLRIIGRHWGTLQSLAAGVVVISLIILAIPIVFPFGNARFLAGSGGVEGGRPAGEWLRTHTPVGTRLVTIGPSMANILQFYGHRRAQGLSVSPNPLYHNPS